MSNYITTAKKAELPELLRELQEIARTMLSGCFTPRVIARKMEEIDNKLNFIEPEVDPTMHAKVKNEHASVSLLYTRLTESE
ncbi:hypothetical protein EVB87_241 [Rhizobium phage RHph_N28_1]|nr:hypothetical protein EVB87_241 [Rhizobium phage RHph_N28_1]QIG74270.1 hypothetical protein EVC07_242 [Rhizobium phage RHph_N42]QXV73930.1 hypothetical protein [Rhizobium phage RHph_N46]